MTLLYRSEYWRMTEHDLAKLSSFHMTSLRKIQRIFWPSSISNRDLFARCQQEDKYGDHHNQEAMVLDWARAAQGCQLHHRSFNPLDPSGKAEEWSTEDNLAKNCGSRNKNMNHSWGTIQRLASDRQGWRSFVAASRRDRW